MRSSLSMIRPFAGDADRLRCSATTEPSTSKDKLWREWLDAKANLQNEVSNCLKCQEAIVVNLMKNRPEDEYANPETQKLPTIVDEQQTPSKAAIMKNLSFEEPIEIDGSTEVGRKSIDDVEEWPKAKNIKDAWANSPTEQIVTTIDKTALQLPGTGETTERPKKKISKQPTSAGFNRSMEKTAAGGYVVHYEDGRTFERDLSLSDVVCGKVDLFMKRFPPVVEPDRIGCVANFTRSKTFLAICPMIIVFDAIYTTWNSNYMAADPLRPTTPAMQVVEMLFSMFYLFELTVKVWVHKRFFFTSFSDSTAYWNWFDFILVLQALSDVVLTYVVTSQGGSATFLRLLRLLKLGKILRLFRAIRFLRDLSVMILAIMNCLIAMFWAFIVLSLVLYVFALMLVQTMTGWRVENMDTMSDDLANEVESYFGSVEKAMLALFMSATAGINWIDMYRIVRKGGALASVAFIFFIGFFGFAVITILSGIFIEKALTASQPDRESMALEHRRAEQEESSQMKDLILSMDTDQSGTLTLEEFTRASDDLYVKSYLRSLGLDIQDGVMFFNLLVSLTGSDELPIEDFVSRLGRMKGNATSMDLQSLMFEVSVLRKEISVLVNQFPPPGGKPVRVTARGST